MAEESDLEKSEAPTQHRQEKAREEGQIPRSRELTSMLMLLVGCAMLWLDGAYLARQLAAMLAQGLHFDHGLIGNDRQSLSTAAPLLSQTVLALVPLFAGLILVALGAPMLLGGITFNPSLIKFDIKKLNPLSELKRMFSAQVLAELFKAILKAVVFGCVTGGFLWLNWPHMLHLVMEPAVPALGDTMWIITACMPFIIVGLSPIVGFDVFWQLWSHLKKLRMSRQGIRNDFKNQEGDPQVKSRIRQQQRAMARRRMMADVPKADVVITNPTHFAVALRYEDGKRSAPEVLAKGVGGIALRIRAVAAEHRIPQLEAPPLARALYRHSEIGQTIPTALYAAVAEVAGLGLPATTLAAPRGRDAEKTVDLPVPVALDFDPEEE